MRRLSKSKNTLLPCRWKDQHVSNSGLSCHWGAFFFSLFFCFHPLKFIALPSWLLIFQLQFLFSYLYFFLSWLFCKSFICFQFYPFNPNLRNIIFSNFVFILWIFFPWIFHGCFIFFQIHHSIQINGIMFFNLVLIVLIFIFFLGSLQKL